MMPRLCRACAPFVQNMLTAAQLLYVGKGTAPPATHCELNTHLSCVFNDVFRLDTTPSSQLLRATMLTTNNHAPRLDLQREAERVKLNLCIFFFLLFHLQRRNQFQRVCL